MAALLDRMRGRDENGEETSLGAWQRGLTALRVLMAASEAAFDDPGLLRMPPLGDIR
jgi:hypothetical protein